MGIELYIWKLKEVIEKNNEVTRETNEVINTLVIPPYQRPYTWEQKTANTLFSDVYEAFNNGQQEYRLGTLVLHKEGNEYNIVDGQQRLITLALILKLYGENFLLDTKIIPASWKQIKENHKGLEKRVEKLGEKKEDYKKYLLEHCSFAVVITNDQAEAFQFFDSQNTGGKSLEPHDLLKAYHLREMADMRPEEKISVVEKWEARGTSDLSKLFATYLYPVTRWHKGKSGLYYSKKDIGTFKGISKKCKYNYALYHKRSIFFAEKIDRDFGNFLYSVETNQFQLSQPLIAGKHFFEWTDYYMALKGRVAQKIKEYYEEEQLPKGTGNTYVKELFIAALMFFTDRFCFDVLNNKSYVQMIYHWCYLLRLNAYAVRMESVNNYARGNYNLNNGALFVKINEMKRPDDIFNIELNKGTLEYRGKYPAILPEI